MEVEKGPERVWGAKTALDPTLGMEYRYEGRADLGLETRFMSPPGV